jgi:hypothetical protein
MTRLLLCTATILALTASAHAQRESGNYMGGFYGTNILGNFRKDSTCSWSIAKDPWWCNGSQPRQPPKQRGKS